MKGESEGGRKKIRERRVKNERNREGVTDRQIDRLTDKQTNKQRNSKQDRDRALTEQDKSFQSNEKEYL